MEDKWFSYMDGNTLYAHRSWTGYCIYIIEINVETGVHDVTVNRDTKYVIHTVGPIYSGNDSDS